MFLVTGRAYSVAATALRFFNVFGPRQSLSNPYTGVAAIFSSRLMTGSAPIIFEDGHQSRDFVHVSDIAAAVVAALDPAAADGEVLNVGTGRAVTIAQVAATLAEELGVDVEPEIRNEYRAGDIRHCFADVTRAKELLGYQPRVSFEEGMRELVGWLSGASAIDKVAEATAALEQRGLTI
jgi:dTDP-L-rhamnose 4-epimerase